MPSAGRGGIRRSEPFTDVFGVPATEMRTGQADLLAWGEGLRAKACPIGTFDIHPRGPLLGEELTPVLLGDLLQEPQDLRSFIPRTQVHKHRIGPHHGFSPCTTHEPKHTHPYTQQSFHPPSFNQNRFWKFAPAHVPTLRRAAGVPRCPARAPPPSSPAVRVHPPPAPDVP